MAAPLTLMHVTSVYKRATRNLGLYLILSHQWFPVCPLLAMDLVKNQAPSAGVKLGAIICLVAHPGLPYKYNFVLKLAVFKNRKT